MSETPDPIEEAVALAIHEARFAHPERPREPTPWDKGDREYAFRLTQRAISAHLAALKASGFVVVPFEPTVQMLNALSDAIADNVSDEKKWQAMIEARPTR